MDKGPKLLDQSFSMGKGSLIPEPNLWSAPREKPGCFSISGRDKFPRQFKPPPFSIEQNFWGLPRKEKRAYQKRKGLV